MISKLRRMLVGGVLAIVMCAVIIPADVLAVDVEVSAKREDTYNLLRNAMQVNVITSAMQRCIDSIPSNGSKKVINGVDAASGKIFLDNGLLNGVSLTNISTSLWLENQVGDQNGLDGQFWCEENNGAIFNMFVAIMKGKESKSQVTVADRADILCNGDKHRLIKRAYGDKINGAFISTYFLDQTDSNCSDFNAKGALYLRASDAKEQFRQIYEDYYNKNIGANRFLPTYDEIGSYDNMDGYFSYIDDFGLYCNVAATSYASKDGLSGTYYDVIRYTKDDDKIIAKNYYYQLNNDRTWTESLASNGANIRSCSGLLTQIKKLQEKGGNGVARTGRDNSGYGNVLIGELKTACQNAYTEEGASAWKALRDKLQNVLDDPNASAQNKADARERLPKVENVIETGDFIEVAGDEDDEGGKVYQCLTVEGLDIDVEGVDPIISEEEATELNNNSKNDACYDGSGALGWLICPVVKMLSGIGEHMWNQIETYHLKLPANDLFKNDGGVQRAWGTVRDIANVLFVILFLFVIFSQLTGIGIDNYGVKKILPKLIVTAILINLSFWICALAVDLSNIVGMGANSFLTEQANNVAIASGMSGGLEAASWVMTALLGGGGIALFVVLNPAGALAATAAIGLAVLGLIITVVSSMFFMYVTLIAREAGVILMIVVAPVAIACYMLPNTEKIYKKWFDLFKALLIVYPICGALIGAGQLAGAVLASIDSENMKIAAMLVQVVPFFLLPMIIRNSLSLMGNIGNRLAAWGRTAGRRGSNAAQGAIRNTRGFQEWSKYQQEQASSNRAQRLRDRLYRRSGGNISNMSARDRERYLDAIRAVNARTQRQAEASVGAMELSDGTAMLRAQATRDAQEMRASEEEMAGYTQDQLLEVAGLKADSNGNFTQVTGANGWFNQPGGAQRMAALIRTMESRGMEENVFSLLGNNGVSNAVSNSSVVMQALAGSKNYLMQAYGKKGVGQTFSAFEAGGGLSKYISENGISNADKDSLKEINANAPVGAIPPEMMMHGAIASQVPKVRNQMNRAIENQIANMSSFADLDKFKIKAEDFGSMQDDTAQTMLTALAGYIKTKNPTLSTAQCNAQAQMALKTRFAAQVAAAKADSRIGNKVSLEVRAIFGF